MRRRWVWGLALVSSLVLVGFSTVVQAQQGQYGPFDYTNPRDVRDKLPIVEAFHFSPDVENLIKGETSAYIYDDLDYVLRAFPNHHRALDAMARLWLKYEAENKKPPSSKPRHEYHNPDYWFDKAMEFTPHDGVVPLLYAIYLHRAGKLDAALKYYEKAISMEPDSPEAHYNLGLLYVARKEYRLAKLHAEKAYSLGYPLPGLRNELIAAGVWADNAKH
jgi:tetratricopeptide (TPR) repeat protein